MVFNEGKKIDRYHELILINSNLIFNTKIHFDSFFDLIINKEVNGFYRFIIIQIQISKMSLFVGNVSKHVTMKEIENLFKKYGKCKIDLRVIL